MSPFGARGLNSGVADAENLAWKLALVLGGRAPDALLDSYDAERRAAAVENLAVTDASMRFMVPHGPLRRGARNAILRGSVRFATLRRLVNSGRLSQPFTYAGSPVVAPAARRLAPAGARGGGPRRALHAARRERKGAAARPDRSGVPVSCSAAPPRSAPPPWRFAPRAWRGRRRAGSRSGADRPLRGVSVLRDDAGELRAAYGAAGSRAWLIRPDGHLAAWSGRWPARCGRPRCRRCEHWPSGRRIARVALPPLPAASTRPCGAQPATLPSAPSTAPGCLPGPSGDRLWITSGFCTQVVDKSYCVLSPPPAMLSCPEGQLADWRSHQRSPRFLRDISMPHQANRLDAPRAGRG